MSEPTNKPRNEPTDGSPDGSTDDTASAASRADWRRDPYGRSEYRYFDGDRWTAWIATDGVTSTDPLGVTASIPFALPMTDPTAAFDSPSTDGASWPAPTGRPSAADDEPGAASGISGGSDVPR